MSSFFNCLVTNINNFEFGTWLLSKPNCFISRDIGINGFFLTNFDIKILHFIFFFGLS